jgi:CRP-like cAMP-binding protein
MIQKVKGVCDPFYGSIPKNDLFNDPTKPAGIPEATKSIEPDHTVFDPGDCSDLIYVLQNGEADIYVQDNRQHRTLSHSVEHDRMYGLIEAVSGGQMWYSMKTRTNCTFSVVHRDKLIAALSRDPALCFKLAQILSRMNREILSFAAG